MLLVSVEAAPLDEDKGRAQLPTRSHLPSIQIGAGEHTSGMGKLTCAIAWSPRTMTL
jgi:hypothetical protein